MSSGWLIEVVVVVLEKLGILLASPSLKSIISSCNLE